MSLVVNDPVCVYSRSGGTWLRDGVVVQVLEEAACMDGQSLPAGAVKVVYANAESAKWVPPESFGDEIKAPDYQKGDKVMVFVRSKGLWVSDGLIEEVLESPANVDEQDMPVGAVKVSYLDKESAKWIPPELFGSELRALRDFIPEDAQGLAYAAPGEMASQVSAKMFAEAIDEAAIVVSQVQGAAKAAGGRYAKVATHNEKPKYKNCNGAIIYFDDWWKLNLRDDVKQWCYEVRGATSEPEPPKGTWQCTRFYKNGSHPPLDVMRAGDTDVVTVAGATGKSGIANGPYQQVGTHNEMPKFKNAAGAIVFFDAYWKLNVADDTWTWHYSCKEGTGSVPPSGNWAPQRSVGAETPVVVRCSLS